MTEQTSTSPTIYKSVFWNTLSNIIGKIIVLALGFLLTPFLLSRLGQDLYGLWALFGSVVGYGMLLDFGISGAVVRYVSAHRALGENEEASKVVSTALFLYALIGIIVVLAGIALSPTIAAFFKVQEESRPAAIQLIAIAALVVGMTIPWLLMGAVLRGLQRFDLVNLVTVGGSLFYWAGIFAVIQMHGSVVSLAAVQLLMMILMGAAGFYLTRRIAPDVRVRWGSIRRSIIRKILGFSVPVFIVALAWQFQTQTDEVVIGAFMAVGMITPYYLARRLSEIPQMLTDQFMRVLLPVASQLHAEKDFNHMRALYLDSTRLTLVAFIPLAVILIMLSGSILTVWVGAEYASSAPLLVVLTLSSLINTSQWPAGSILQSMSRQKVLAGFAAGSAVVNLALSIALIRPFGLMGVALGTLIPTAVENIGLIFPFILRVLGVQPATAARQILAPAFLPAVPMILAVYGLQILWPPTGWLEIFGISGAGLLVYLAGYLRFGAGQRERALYWDLVSETKTRVQKQFMRSGSGQ